MNCQMNCKCCPDQYDWGSQLNVMSTFSQEFTSRYEINHDMSYLVIVIIFYLSFALSLSLVIQSVSQWARERGNLGKASYYLGPFSSFVLKLMVFLPLVSCRCFTFGELVVTLLKILTRTRKRVISRDIRPAIILASVIMSGSLDGPPGLNF